MQATWATHLDYQNIVLAHVRVKEIAAIIENRSADAISVSKVMELSVSIIQFKLVVPHRRYIADIDCTVTYLLDSPTPMPLVCILSASSISFVHPPAPFPLSTLLLHFHFHFFFASYSRLLCLLICKIEIVVIQRFNSVGKTEKR